MCSVYLAKISSYLTLNTMKTLLVTVLGKQGFNQVKLLSYYNEPIDIYTLLVKGLDTHSHLMVFL